jgi:hypothetical protein
VPVLVSAEDLAQSQSRRLRRLARELEDEVKALLDGKRPEAPSFQEFLRRQERQHPGFADELLGKEAAALWREGKITLRQLVDRATGRPKTNAEL